MSEGEEDASMYRALYLVDWYLVATVGNGALRDAEHGGGCKPEPTIHASCDLQERLRGKRSIAAPTQEFFPARSINERLFVQRHP